MKTLLMVISLTSIVVVLIFLFLWLQSKSGQAIGLVNDKLSDCTRTPNCVSSENKQDEKHHIDAITYTLSKKETAALLESIISEMGGKINIADKLYVAATFTSPVFGFVDDLEIRLDLSDRLIHVRSASRVGYSDGGINRKRIETLARLYAKRSA